MDTIYAPECSHYMNCSYMPRTARQATTFPYQVKRPPSSPGPDARPAQLLQPLLQERSLNPSSPNSRLGWNSYLPSLRVNANGSPACVPFEGSSDGHFPNATSPMGQRLPLAILGASIWTLPLARSFQPGGGSYTQSQGMKVLPYLDDWLICTQSQVLAARQTFCLLSEVANLGLKIHMGKAV